MYPFPEIVKSFFSLDYMYSLVTSVFPKYVVLRSVLSLNSVMHAISLHECHCICQSIHFLFCLLQILCQLSSFHQISSILYYLLCFLSSKGFTDKLGVASEQELPSTYLIKSPNIDQLIICSILASSLDFLFKIAIW